MSYLSPIGNCPVIGDDNWQEHVKHSDEASFGRGFEGPSPEGYGAAALVEFPKALIIPMDQWDERIEEQERTESTLYHMIRRVGLKVKNQGQTNYCWAFSATWATEIIRVKQNQPYRELSATSVACLVKNYRNVGGWGDEALDFISNVGPTLVSLWPERQLQKTFDNPESRAAREQNRVTKWWKPRTLLEYGSALLRRIPVSGGHNFWRHQVTHVRLVKRDGRQRYGGLFGNSWDVTYGDDGYGVLEGDRMLPDDMCCPAVTEGA